MASRRYPNLLQYLTTVSTGLEIQVPPESRQTIFFLFLIFTSSTGLHSGQPGSSHLWFFQTRSLLTFLYLEQVTFILSINLFLGFPGGSISKKSTYNAGDPPECRRPRFNLWIRKILWRRIWQSTPILAWRIPWTEEPGGLQSMSFQESDTIKQLSHHQICFWLDQHLNVLTTLHTSNFLLLYLF